MVHVCVHFETQLYIYALHKGQIDRFLFRLFQSGLPDGLNMDKLLAILKGYGEYPAKYRYNSLVFNRFCEIYGACFWIALLLSISAFLSHVIAECLFGDHY